MTDASDYGVGAYLYQLVGAEKHTNEDGEVQYKGGTHRCTALLSKTLSGAQLNWTTQEKEAYAIWWAVTSLDYALRDRPFTILTDHRSLQYIANHPSQKVNRWKISLAELDCQVIHVSGVQNDVADGLSRRRHVSHRLISNLQLYRCWRVVVETDGSRYGSS